ncbi:MAG: alpha/beta fold hydrolase [Dehalococcoidia bacterium]
MPFIETPEGIRIRYEERGEGRPIVLAHGFGVALEMWMPQVLALSKEHRLIIWDARGHGGSSAPEDPESYSMPALAQDLRGLLEAIGAVEGAVIGGMSFGGQIALQYAIDHPSDVHALVLSDSVTRGDDAPGDPKLQARAWGIEGDPGLEGAMRAMGTRPDLTPRLGELTMPTLLLVGELDERIVAGVPRMADGLPKRRVVYLAGCVHGTSGQRPAAWNQAVLDFLADVEAGAELGETLAV